MTEKIFPMKNLFLSASVGFDELHQKELRLGAVLSRVRESMLAPSESKVPPVFNIAQLAQIIDIEKTKIPYRMSKGDLPGGTLNESGTKRQWTLAEARLWAKEYRQGKFRPVENSYAVTICIANFKGGVSKTTTVATLAQALSTRGHNVLVIDTDPQGSLTELFGIQPNFVKSEETILPLFQGGEHSLDYAVRPTYWDGVDIVSASPIIYDIDISTPLREHLDSTFNYWSVLDGGLDNLRDKYDVILIDTPPALSNSTINALVASDGLVMPIPPNMLDFASSAQFLRLYRQFSEIQRQTKNFDKKFDFMNVLLTRVDNQEFMTAEVRRWIVTAYGDSVLPIEIPKTSMATTASAEFGTVYDISGPQMSTKTWKRAHDAYERFSELMEDQLISIWANRARGALP